MSRARQMQISADRQMDRTDQEIEFGVIRAYFAALLAAKQAEVAEQAEKTAQSILEQSQSRFDAGVVVESDLLTAKVRKAARDQELIAARNNLDLTRAELNTAMGVAADSVFEVVTVLSERALPSPVLMDLEKQALERRPDLASISAQQVAQQQSVAIAKSSFGPRVNAFAGWELDNPTLFAGGGGNNWLGGVEVQFDLFQGGAKRAELSRQKALEEKDTAMKQSASDNVRLEVRKAYYQTDASRKQVEVARAAIAQAQESLRINQDRYESGLTTMTDLLGAEESARRSQMDYYEAIYRFQTSYASLELAGGTLSPQSAVVMP
jgi:outer membrane protein TolC